MGYENIESKLSLAGIFYRNRDEWIRHLMGRSKSQLQPSEKLVGVYIAMRMNPETRMAWPMQTTMARELDVSVDTVKRAIKKLVASQLLSIIRVKGTRGHPVNHYKLELPWWE